jgi:NAD(P)-dependent dehydrogenase (short-subunit alcohol dehydrogenase family)
LDNCWEIDRRPRHSAAAVLFSVASATSSDADDKTPPLAATSLLVEQVRAVTDLLEYLAADWRMLDQLSAEDRRRLHQAIAALSTADPRANRKRRKAAKSERVRQEDALLNETGIRSLRRRPASPPQRVSAADLRALDVHGETPANEERRTVPNAERRTPNAEPLRPSLDRVCYICKAPYSTLHAFYDQLCPGCADVNFAARTELADLRGRVALLTGGRVKIGYQAGLILLRSGAHLIVTTRFPRNAAARYAQEPDFGDWGHRLEIFGLDLRHTPSVEAFCRGLVTSRDRLDFIINNACQTVRRPPDFYAHMIAEETAAAREMPGHVRRLLGDADSGREGRDRQDRQTLIAAQLSQVPLLAEELLARAELFPAGHLDGDLQQVDLRDRNSWRMLLADVPTIEMLEVQLVNAIAPFLFNARLKPLMPAPGTRQAHRQRLGRRGPVLPHQQDDEASAHEHGEGGAQHDDPDRRRTTSTTAST